MVDGIQDTRNLGAIIRSAYCTGADGLIICKKQGAPLNASTVKASAGMIEYMEIYYAPSAIAAAKELKADGYNLYLATLGGENVTKTAFQGPLCIVIGNEATGVSSDIFPLGKRVMLPQRSPTISYNASVAAGILLYLIATQQGKI
jgi:rRNA methylases